MPDPDTHPHGPTVNAGPTCRPRGAAASVGGAHARGPVRWPVVAAVLALVVGAALRLAPHPSGLWLDELYTAWAADPGAAFVPAFWQRMAPDFQPPGYYPLMWAWHHLAGSDAAHSRLLGGLAVTAAVPLAAALLRGVLPSRALAAAVAVLALAWPGVVFAHEARAYALLYALACVGYALVLRSTARGPSASLRLGLCAVALGAGAVHYYGMVLGGALLVAQTTASHATRAWRAALPDAACGAAVAGVYLAVLVWQAPLQTGDAADWLRNDWLRIARGYRELLAPNDLAAGAVVLLGAAALVGRLPARLQGVLAVGIGVSVLVPVLVSLHTPALTARYLIITVPPLALWAGARAGTSAGTGRTAAWMLAAAALAGADARVWTRFKKEEWRAGAALVAAHHRPGCALPVWHWWPGVYVHYLPAGARAALVTVPTSGPVPAPAPGCAVWLWAGHPNALTVDPPPGARVVRLYGQEVWLAPSGG